MAATASPDGARGLASARRVVLKLGSSTLQDIDLDALAAELVRLREGPDPREIAIVTSGAVAHGMAAMGLTERPDSLLRVQALASIGQVDLMARYRAAFARHDVVVGQILLTHQDMAARRHFLNVRHTLSELFAMGVVPIANENDTVATEELRFGDNDRLAAAFATVVDADLVVLLSDVDALYDADPRLVEGARPVRNVARIDDGVRAMAGLAGSGVGTGGMVSKIAAAEVATDAGIPLVIARGDDPSILGRILAGDPVGTCFHADPSRVRRRRHWIRYLSRLKGTVVIDAGAVTALRDRGGSLLSIGVTAVHGAFERGDGVAIVGPDQSTIARGLVAYDAATLDRIRGLRTDAARAVLARSAVDPVVHRNDMVLTPRP